MLTRTLTQRNMLFRNELAVPGSLRLVFLVGVSTLVVCTGEPRFTEVPGNLIATIGDDVVFNWAFTEEADFLLIHWLHSDVGTIMYDRGELTVQERYEGRVERVGQASFKLLDVSVSDAGTYRIEVLFLGGANLEDTATLDVRYPPTGTSISTQRNGHAEETTTAKEGDVLKLTCRTDSHPPAQFSWTRHQANVSPLSESVTVNATSGVLTVPNVRKNDTGLYLCRASNGIQPDGIASINVTIQYPPTMTTAFILSPREGNAMEGDEVRLGCRVGDALPRPSFQWKRIDKTGGLPISAIVDEKTGYLVITSVRPTDAGVYRCIADNGVEPVGFSSIQLNVTAEPEVGHLSNRTRKPSELVAPLSASLPSAGVCFVVGFVIAMRYRKVKRQNNRDPVAVVDENPCPDDPLLYLSPDSTIMRLTMATEKEKTVDPIVQEFWDYLVKMDADPVLVFFQEKKVLTPDHTAVIRAATSVVDKLLKEICVLEGEKSPQLLSKALRHTDQNHLADLLDGKTLPDVKCLCVVNVTDSSFSIQFKRAYTNIQHFGDVDKYVVTLEVAIQEPETMATRCLNASDQLQAEFTNLASGTSYNVTVVSVKGDIRSVGVTVTVTTFGGYEEPSGLLAKLSEDERSQIHHVLIYKDKITLKEPLGKGNFGEVRHGVYVAQDRCVSCAVKTLFDTASHHAMKSLLKEGLRMVNFRHDNVLQLIGMCVHGNEAMIVLPYMKHGDLHKFLRNKQTLPREENLRLCLEIAHGMAYLTDKGIVHRDLAARNCMLDENLHVKVADFGLCRDVHEKGYYRIQNWEVKLPYKWMAPESHEDYIFDTKTDVWSYGIVLWEIFSGGKTPYPDVPSVHLQGYLKEGHRMERPNKCPMELYNDVMQRCWHKDPTKRPLFKEVLEKVKQINKSANQRPEVEHGSSNQQTEVQDVSGDRRSEVVSEGRHSYIDMVSEQDG